MSRKHRPYGRANKKSKGRSKLDKAKGYRIQPIRKQGDKIRRNDPCPCGSGRKFKVCCGKPEPPPPTVRNPYQTMAATYTDEQKQAEQDFVKQWGFNPNPSQLMAYMEGAHEELEEAILRGMEGIEAEEKFFYAVKKLHRLITPKNQKLVSPEEAEAWEAAIAEYDDANGRGVSDEGSPGEPESGSPETDERTQEEAAG
jgi:hypothetical protein